MNRIKHWIRSPIVGADVPAVHSGENTERGIYESDERVGATVIRAHEDAAVPINEPLPEGS